jgi:protein-L-isoaspartate(D-aspartate) O-methyltransferase
LRRATTIAAAAVIAGGCGGGTSDVTVRGKTPSDWSTADSASRNARPTGQGELPPQEEDDRFVSMREHMVDDQIQGRDITDERVLAVMRRVPRHRFVPDKLQEVAYADRPLPIGHGQTISQPYIVALMTQLARPEPGSRALDIGTGSGYQAAVLAELVDHVYSIEILKPLADSADARLKELGYTNVDVRWGDGYKGWPEHAPFDVIIVAAAPDHVPQPLVDQLAAGGRMVIPVGEHYQELLLIEKDSEGRVHQRSVAPVAFVPMTDQLK